MTAECGLGQCSSKDAVKFTVLLMYIRSHLFKYSDYKQDNLTTKQLLEESNWLEFQCIILRVRQQGHRSL